MAYQRTLPPPTWQGFDRHMVAKYTAFLKQDTGAQNNITNCEYSISDFERTIQRYADAIRQSRQQVREAQEQLREIDARSILSDDDLSQSIARLTELPYVVGTRTDSSGLLIVGIRLTHSDTDGSVYDLGDYEVILGFHVETYRGRDLRPTLVKLRRGASVSQFAIDNFNGINRDMHGNLVGYLGTVDSATTSTQLIDGQVDALLETIHEALCSDARRYDLFKPEQAIPALIWEGYWPNAVAALRSSIASETRVNDERERIADIITRRESDMRQYNETLTSLRKQLREQRAKLQQLKAQLTQQHEPDPAKAERTLRYIMTLPGVMGIKFNESGVPVIHVRASHAHRDQRYDFGDYEFTLSPNRITGEGVLVSAKSRGTHGIWDHFRDGYHDGGWFCFGSRASELRDMLQTSSHADLMHLLINTLNGVNDGYERHLPDRYNQIPIGLVWQTVDRPLRTHRDRHAHTQVQTEMGRAAIDLTALRHGFMGV